MLTINVSETHLAKGDKKFCFRSNCDQTLDTDQLVKAMVGYNSTLTEADVKACLTVLTDRIKYYANLGYKVELPFGYVYLKATGTVEHVYDGFNPNTQNHRITASFRFKDPYAKEIEATTSYRQGSKGFVSNPEINAVFCILSNGKESEDLSAERGTIIRLRGKYLSFDTTDPKQGVFFVDSSNKETRAVSYSRTGTSVTDLFIPQELAEGNYKLKLVTKPGTERYATSIYEKSVEVIASGRG